MLHLLLGACFQFSALDSEISKCHYTDYHYTDCVTYYGRIRVIFVSTKFHFDETISLARLVS